MCDESLLVTVSCGSYLMVSSGEMLTICHFAKIRFSFLPPANEVCEGYVFTRVCLSTGGGGGRVASQHALQVVSWHALQVSGGRVYPSMPCRFPGRHPRGNLRGLARGGAPGPHLGGAPGPDPGGSPGPHLGGYPSMH